MPLFSSQQRTRILGRQQSAPQAPEPGATASNLLRRYRPLETRAAGGFGSVEICLDSRLQRRVAIKRIPLASPDARIAAETVASALAEARTASMLQHPHIVSVIDFTYDAAYAYLVMEYVDGMDLSEFLAQVDGHSLTYDEAACIADALVQALSFAHENGVLHLDIKPGNVLIDRNGHVKLTDFGMATLTSAAGFGGARGGTIGYMAPEQLRGDAVDERSDIFSLATVLYESLCGTSPFRAGTPADSEEKIERGVLYPSDLLPDIPEGSEEALLRALSPAPQARMASVAEFGELFLDHLGNAREGRKSLASLIARLTSDEEDPDETAARDRVERVWELDPAEGYLGSRSPHARKALAGAVAGCSVAAASWIVLGCLGLVDAPARLAGALAIGAAAGAAPQIGSALLFCGLAVVSLNNPSILAALPVAALVAAVGSGWCLASGRCSAPASASLVAACALAAAIEDPFVAAPLVAATAGCLAHGAGAASAVGLGMLLGRLARAALAAGGVLDLAVAASALADPALLAASALAAGAAAGIAALMAWAWSRLCESRGTGAYAAAYLVPIAVSILLVCLANPMEIASSTPLRIATVAGSGIASSIIIGIYVYLFGYRTEPTGV